MKISAIETEKTILKELGYEYYRLIENQPHKYLPSYIKLMKLKSKGLNHFKIFLIFIKKKRIKYCLGISK